jgi:hypothetical protein
VANREKIAEDVDLRTLLGNIAHDARALLTEQIALFRSEVGQELRRAGTAAGMTAAGGGLAAAGGLLSGFMLAHLLRRLTGLPEWACYGLAAGGLGAAGVALLRAGRDGFADLRPLPQTTEALGENLQWLREQLTPAG